MDRRMCLAVAAVVAAGTSFLTTVSGTSLAEGCAPDQIFDETQAACISAVVGNGPVVGSDYGGTICVPTKFYDAPEQGCALDVVTNDPKAPVQIEGVDSTNLPVPTVAESPGCAADPAGGCK